MNLSTIDNCTAEVSGNKVNVKVGFYGDLYVKYRNRYRLVQVDDSGATYIEAPGATVYVPITGLPATSETISKRYYSHLNQ